VAPAGTAISPNAASNAPDPAAKPFRVQTYSSQVLGEVARRAGILRKAGVACRIVPAEIPGRGTWYRIRLGGFSTREEAVSAGESLVARGLAETYWVVQ
jgi:cell division protein FtsN